MSDWFVCIEKLELGNGEGDLYPIPNPQSPIPNLQSPIPKSPTSKCNKCFIF